MKSRMVKAIVVMAALGTVAIAEDEGPQLQMYFHNLVLISQTNIVLEGEGNPMVFVATTNTVYLSRDGKKLTWEDFKPKDSTRVTFFEKDGKQVATEVLKHAGYFTVSPPAGGVNLNP